MGHAFDTERQAVDAMKMYFLWIKWIEACLSPLQCSTVRCSARKQKICQLQECHLFVEDTSTTKRVMDVAYNEIRIFHKTELTKTNCQLYPIQYRLSIFYLAKNLGIFLEVHCGFCFPTQVLNLADIWSDFCYIDQFIS